MIADTTPMNREQIRLALNEMKAHITHLLSQGHRVRFTGFGTFRPQVRPARVCRNPFTKEMMKVSAKIVPKFKGGATLKNYLNGEGAKPDDRV